MPRTTCTNSDSPLRSFDTNGKCGHAAEFTAREPLGAAQIIQDHLGGIRAPKQFAIDDE
jgi:hypothetical protein